MAKNKKEKGKSVMEIAREMEAQQQKLAEEQRELARQKEAEQRRNYEEQLRQERLELMRLKQGVIEESETIHEEKPEEKHYTIGQKIGNFFYHNKWWMGIAAFFVFVVGFLTYSQLTQVHPDMIVLLVADDDYFYAVCGEQIEHLFEQYIEDENEDGKVKVTVYYIPSSDAKAQTDGFTGNAQKLYTEFQIGEAVLVISDDEADKRIVPEDTLYDLEADFGQYQETEQMRFRLAGTDFAKDVGWTDEPLDDDFYIGIRSVRKTMDSEEKMQEVFDISYPALKAFIQDYGTPEEEGEDG